MLLNWPIRRLVVTRAASHIPVVIVLDPDSDPRLFGQVGIIVENPDPDLNLDMDLDLTFLTRKSV
jgi:hypothetical protein